MKKRLWSAILAMCIVLTMTPITAFAADDAEDTTKTEVETTAVQSEPEDNTESGAEEEQPEAPAETPTGTVISEDTTWNEATTLTDNLTVNEGVTLTIDALVTVSGDVTVSGGGTIKRGENYQDSLIAVPESSSLTLSNIIIDGGAQWSGDTDETLLRGTVNSGISAAAAAITVNGGEMTLNSGAVIQNNERIVGTEVEDWIEYRFTETTGDENFRYYAVGGGISVIHGNLTMNTGSSVKNNAILDSDKLNEKTTDALGGGIGLYDAESFVVNGGVISGNQSDSSNDARAMGGGIGLVAHQYSQFETCKVRIHDGEIKNNRSLTSGGGGYFTTDCVDETGVSALDVAFDGGTVSYNKANGSGGGAMIWGCKAAVSGDVAFTYNEASNTNGSGGGVLFSTRTDVTVNGGTYSHNSSYHGGGIAWTGAKFEFKDGEVSQNTAVSNGGGMRLYNNTADNPAIISGGTISDNTASSSGGIYADYLTITGGTVTGNIAEGANSTGGNGGGIFVSHILKMSGDTNISNNTAGAGGGIFVNSQPDSTFEITGGTISENRAINGSGGGAIFYTNRALNKDIVAFIDGANITGNVAEKGAGGAINLYYGFFEMRSGTISGNKALIANGGGVMVGQNGTMTLIDGTISNNEANQGGGICLTGKVTMNGGRIHENVAKPYYNTATKASNTNNNGGGVAVAKGSTFIMNAGSISENTAKYGAGIATWMPQKFEIHGGEISGNRTETMTITYTEDGQEKQLTVNGTYGGGITLGDATTLVLTGGAIINNSANAYGGGINVPPKDGENDSIKVLISNNPIITGNTANGTTNNLYLSAGNGKRSMVTISAPMTSGAAIGVATPTNVTEGNPIQISAAETDTEYYKNAARYFIPDAANVIAQANDTGKYVELAYTTDTYRKVTLNLTHANATGGLITQVKNGDAYSAAVTADTGYTLPATLDGVDKYDRSANNQTAIIGINSVTADKTIEIAAVPNKYTVAFDGNGNTSGSMDAQAMTYDTSATLSANAYAKTGFNFVGWSTTADGSCEYPDKASVKNMTAENGATVKLYAVWSAKKSLSAFDSSDSAIQSHKYDGSPKAYALTSDVDGFDISYQQNGEDVTPINVGSYDVIISRDEDDTYAAFSQTIVGGLVITAADYPVTVTADKTTMTGAGSVKLTVSSSVAGITVTGITCSDEDITATKNDDDTYSAELPNTTKTYTFTAQVEGDLSNYGEGPATCTVSVTRKSSSSGGSSSSSSSTTNTVSASTASNGKVTMDKTTAKKGDTVTITVTPDADYELGRLTVTDSKGNTIATTKKGDNQYTFTMPDGKVTVTPTFTKIADEKPSANGYVDVASSAWYNDAVQYVTDKGLMSGTGDNKFSPNASTTRGMLMTVLARYAGQDTSGSTPWYQKGMDWAKANGVSDGTNPTVNITREQLVTMLYRYAGSPAASGSLSDFSDASTVSTYAVNAMQWAMSNGIVNGSNGKLNPKNNATRAEVAVILMRFCEMNK